MVRCGEIPRRSPVPYVHLGALDPIVETIADKNSYGFPQQWSCADAIEQCFKALRSANTQWVLEGDIKSCFDKISHHLPAQLLTVAVKTSMLRTGVAGHLHFI